MRLLVRLDNADSSPEAATKQTVDMVDVTSDAITLDVARIVADRLRTNFGYVIVDPPMYADEGRTAVVRLRGGDCSYQDIRGWMAAIRQIVNSGLRERGVVVPFHT